MKQYFFSIVIPAHDEEKYILNTINRLLAQSYSKNAYEIIVVENGSTDKTLEIISKRASDNEQIKFFISGKGVSKARNKGKENSSVHSDWTIFLDADTVVEPLFLSELNTFLNTNQSKQFSIGTSEIQPYQDTSKKAKLWFKIYDLGHKYTHTSYSIQICKSSVAKKITYDETLRLAEDLQFIHDAEKFGTFFFFPTKTVLTSTRRFQQTGYYHLFFFWIFFGIMPRWIRRKINYSVIR